MALTWNGMTMEEGHRKLWNDLADNKVDSKREWFYQYNSENENAPRFYCFACEEALSRLGKSDMPCDYCPIGIRTENGCLDGLYDRWREAEGFEKFKLAHEIANLEWKEK